MIGFDKQQGSGSSSEHNLSGRGAGFHLRGVGQELTGEQQKEKLFCSLLREIRKDKKHARENLFKVKECSSLRERQTRTDRKEIQLLTYCRNVEHLMTKNANFENILNWRVQQKMKLE